MTAQDTQNRWATLLPHGQLATRQWLLGQGVSRHALDNALKSGKLIMLARGVVTRPEIPVSWQGLAASLRRELSALVYVGGFSALSEAGMSHYLDRSGRLHLYSSSPQPRWLSRLDLNIHPVWHGTARLWDQQKLLASKSLKGQQLNSGGLLVASTEQAFLEVLAQVPTVVSFEHADDLIKGLSALSPRRLDALLSASRHILAKRLFFFLADRYDYPWRKHLSVADYDLGTGKRSVVAGGKLDKTYLITVPEAFHGSE